MPIQRENRRKQSTRPAAPSFHEESGRIGVGEYRKRGSRERNSTIYLAKLACGFDELVCRSCVLDAAVNRTMLRRASRRRRRSG